MEAHVENHAEVHVEDHTEAQDIRLCRSTSRRPCEAQAEDYIEAHMKGPTETHIEEQELIPILFTNKTKNLLR
ncbi:46111_t:CDS:1, partial [Gigaspora margarita]